MKVRVLGAYGGEGPDLRTSCLLINDRLAVDAGALTSALSLREQAKVSGILISHTHLDHIHDLGFLADNIFGKRDTPVEILGTEKSIQVLKKHFFNNRIWPDFTQIPNSDHPILVCRAFKPGQEIDIAGLKVKPIPVNHPIPSVGFIISDGKNSLLYSGDTGPTERLWKEADKLNNLKLVIIEVSFPNQMEEVAKLSGHLTPKMAEAELAKLKEPPAMVRAFHMKPAFIKELEREMARLKIKITPLKQGEVIEV